MTHKPSDDSSSRLPLIHLLPNILTLTAICAGLTAIRFSIQGEFEMAVQLVLLAGVLDGLDGRVARLLDCQTSVGAELDSLADFVNFGVAPALILYAWTLHSVDQAGWMAVLGYTICCVLRLARFNVSHTTNDSSRFFVGIPSPAGAALVMLPMYVSFFDPDLFTIRPGWMAAYMLLIGFLMISHWPTFSFKSASVPRNKSRLMMLAAVLTVLALMTYLWATLILLSILYAAGLIWSAWIAASPHNNR